MSQQQKPMGSEAGRSNDQSGRAASFDGARDSLLHAGESVTRRARSIWEGFSDFALRDNVLEVATGLIIATAFTAVVNSFITDILTPILGLIPAIHRNLDQSFALLHRGTNFPHGGYHTLQQAQDDGAVVLAYGVFISKLLNFLGLGMTLYTIAILYGRFTNDNIIKHTKKCKYCRKSIGEKAIRCINCTSWQDGREDSMH